MLIVIVMKSKSGVLYGKLKLIKNMLNSYFIIFSLLILLLKGCALIKYLCRDLGPVLGTPAIALVSFNSMYLFGNNLEHVFIQ